LQFTESYPDIDQADTDIYGDAYFAPTIEKRPEREHIFEELLAGVERILGRRGRLLDVGCGEGMLVEVAARRGWHAEGTEISTAMIRYAREERGLTVHHGVLEDLPLERRSYDAIVLNQVLEHTRNPRTTLARAAELLVDDGVVRVDVPNLASFSSWFKNIQSHLKLKSRPWKHYSIGHHFWFFTPHTLEHTVRTAGLSVVRMSAPFAQWGRNGISDRIIDALWARAGLGSCVAVFARPSREQQPTGSA
jgi:2-polyprenyl-3-methyl-5-hydroxy-6-metoxy-1,4-benzoquinol methylase